MQQLIQYMQLHMNISRTATDLNSSMCDDELSKNITKDSAQANPFEIYVLLYMAGI